MPRLQSPLVTSWGAIVVVADNCTMTLMPDPAVSIDKADWLPEVKSWVPGVDLGYEKVFAGGYRGFGVMRHEVRSPGRLGWIRGA